MGLGSERVGRPPATILRRCLRPAAVLAGAGALLLAGTAGAEAAGASGVRRGGAGTASFNDCAWTTTCAAP